MKHLIILVFLFSSTTNLIAQSENTWLDHSYLQLRSGIQHSNAVGHTNFLGDIGYFFNANKLVFGISSNFYIYPNDHYNTLGAKLHFGKFLRNPVDQKWNILLSSGIGYHRASSISQYKRIGTDDSGQPIWDKKQKGGNSFILPLAIELHSNQLSKSGLVIKFETLIDRSMSTYFNCTVGVNINTMK